MSGKTLSSLKKNGFKASTFKAMVKTKAMTNGLQGQGQRQASGLHGQGH